MAEGLEGLLAGRTLVGRYRIQEVIGRGGFAVVYRAEDLRLGRPVAVKVITPPTSDAAARERLRTRFQHEARAAASLPHHPNLVTIHDFGTDQETGIDFLAMELLVGETLTQFIAREPRPPVATALGIVQEAAEGLAVGHQAGLVHRDIKPGNIFLAEAHEASERFRVCVLDFGIAQAMDAQEATLTRHDGVPLSPAYASPEQLRGERRLTPASDVYSLGLVALELLSGRRAFTPHRTAAEQLAPLHFPDDVPPGVREVVGRALEAEPARRFASAGAFAEALDAAARGGPPSAPVPAHPGPADPDATLLYQPAGQPEPQPPARRGRSGRWLLAVPVLALAAALWTLAQPGSSPEPADPQPVGNEAALPGDARPPASAAPQGGDFRPPLSARDDDTALVSRPELPGSSVRPQPGSGGEAGVGEPAPGRPPRPTGEGEESRPPPPRPTPAPPEPPPEPQEPPPAPPPPEPAPPPGPPPLPAPRDTLRLPPAPSGS